MKEKKITKIVFNWIKIKQGRRYKQKKGECRNSDKVCDKRGGKKIENGN